MNKVIFDNECLFCENIKCQLGGAFNVLKYACKQFKKSGGGNVIMLGSVSGVMSPRFDTYEGLKMTTPVAYSCIKSGLISLCKYAAKYLAGSNIRINVIFVISTIYLICCNCIYNISSFSSPLQ